MYVYFELITRIFFVCRFNYRTFSLSFKCTCIIYYLIYVYFVNVSFKLTCILFECMWRLDSCRQKLVEDWTWPSSAGSIGSCMSLALGGSPDTRHDTLVRIKLKCEYTWGISLLYWDMLRWMFDCCCRGIFIRFSETLSSRKVVFWLVDLWMSMQYELKLKCNWLSTQNDALYSTVLYSVYSATPI